MRTHGIVFLLLRVRMVLCFYFCAYAWYCVFTSLHMHGIVFLLLCIRMDGVCPSLRKRDIVFLVLTSLRMHGIMVLWFYFCAYAWYCVFTSVRMHGIVILLLCSRMV